MNIVEPIKDPTDIEKIKDYLSSDNKRNYLLFIIGINTPLKSHLILDLKFSSFFNEDYSLKDFIEIDDRKFFINESIKIAIKDYVIDKNYDLCDYIFQSNKTKNPINRSHLYKILNDAVKECNITIKIGNETLRKTFGYHYYSQTGNVNYLKKLFNKSSSKMLFQYLGISDIPRSYDNFRL